MMTALALVLAVLAALWWVCASPARLAAAGVALLAVHPVPTVAVTAVTVAGATVAAAVLVVRSLRADGWHLVTITRPAAPAAPVGVAVGVA